MLKKVGLVLVLLTILLIGGCSGSFEPSPNIPLGQITGSTVTNNRPAVGAPAPDFQFTMPDGQAGSLSGLKGKPVLINFWTTSCPYCVEEMPYLEQAYQEWSSQGLVVLSINIGESGSAVANFMQGNHMTFPVFLDTRGIAADEYAVVYIPATFIIDKDGIIRTSKVGAFQSAEEIGAVLSKIV